VEVEEALGFIHSKRLSLWVGVDKKRPFPFRAWRTVSKGGLSTIRAPVGIFPVAWGIVGTREEALNSSTMNQNEAHTQITVNDTLF
jgi:hypothetical protein